ncbi:MAG: aspartate-semialdehyde dehydrogenase [Planctomycetota bacterium]
MSTPDTRTPVAVLGATGMVGQRFVSLLDGHPWFKLAEVAASTRSAGRRYADAVVWASPGEVPASAADLVIEAVDEELPQRLSSPLVFSALDAEVAREVEPAMARAGKLVITNASAFRMDPRVPLLVPEVNAEHLALLPGFGEASAAAPPAAADAWGGNGGALIANPNCSTIGLVLALAPLARAFGVEAAHVVSLQALSGAGRPGVSALDALDNVIPFIAGEEDKLATEPGKILGRLVEHGGARRLEPDPVVISAQCNRVPVRDGHTLCVSVRLGDRAGRAPSREDVLAAWREFRGAAPVPGLPSAPPMPVVYDPAPTAPQPLLHREVGRGMTAVIGRLQPCPVLGWRFVCLTHNTLRGAAGGALLCAELALARGWRPTARP